MRKVRELRNEREAAMALLHTTNGGAGIDTQRNLHVGKHFHLPAPRRAQKTTTRKRGFLAVVSKVLKSLGI